MLADVPAGAKVVAEEVFGPVLVVAAVDSLDEALRRGERLAVRAAGRRLHPRRRRPPSGAQRELAVGGVIVGDVPSYRADQMPYGGAKESGVGREGLRAAMDDLTEPRVLVLTGLPL